MRTATATCATRAGRWTLVLMPVCRSTRCSASQAAAAMRRSTIEGSGGEQVDYREGSGGEQVRTPRAPRQPREGASASSTALTPPKGLAGDALASDDRAPLSQDEDPEFEERRRKINDLLRVKAVQAPLRPRRDRRGSGSRRGRSSSRRRRLGKSRLPSLPRHRSRGRGRRRDDPPPWRRRRSRSRSRGRRRSRSRSRSRHQSSSTRRCLPPPVVSRPRAQRRIAAAMEDGKTPLQALLCNIAQLDPSVDHSARERYKHLVRLVPVKDLLYTHAEVSPTFLHEPHKGEPLEQLLAEIRARGGPPASLPELVVVKMAGQNLVVCGNRRLKVLKTYADEMHKDDPEAAPVCVRCIVHKMDFDERACLVAKMCDASTTKTQGLECRVRQGPRGAPTAALAEWPAMS
mmetsp:Transcript_35322/g.110053  ORF Transcript_35322/g.110053 Transcript_35322/m.110053 type:complete len:403 (-) Transcript_35322:174-1382(-)